MGVGPMRRSWKILLLIMVMAALVTGCNESGDTEVIVRDPDPRSGIIEGRAYYPFYDEAGEPVYYDAENQNIHVILYDGNDHPIEEQVTDSSGFYAYDYLPAGWYSVAAEVEEYDPADEVFYIYTISLPLFYLEEGEILHEVNLFLEYSHVES